MQTDNKNTGIATKCVHSGEITNNQGSPHTPIYNSTTFTFSTTNDLLDVIDGRKPGSLYTRYGMNLSIKGLEEKMAQLNMQKQRLFSVRVLQQKQPRFWLWAGRELYAWEMLMVAQSNC